MHGPAPTYRLVCDSCRGAGFGFDLVRTLPNCSFMVGARAEKVDPPGFVGTLWLFFEGG